MPPAPGCHLGPVPWPRRPESSCQDSPPSVELEEGCVFDAGVDGVGVGERGLDVPDALELPRVLGAVVPLVGGEGLAGFFGGVVEEAVWRRGGPLWAFGLAGLEAGLVPGFAAVVGALDELAEPAAGLRGEDRVGVGGRAFHVVDLPAGEVGAGDGPIISFAIGFNDEAAFVGADEDAYGTHF